MALVRALEIPAHTWIIAVFSMPSFMSIVLASGKMLAEQAAAA